MPQTSVEPSPTALSSTRALYPFWLLLILVYVLLMIFVKPVAVGGDSAYYADDIESSLPHAWGEAHQLWNFSHVMWRPLGRALAEAFLPTVAPHFSGNANMSIAFLLLLPNLLAAPVCGVLLLTMIWRLTGNLWMSFLAAAAFLCINPLLHYSRLGSPYIFGITCTTLATYLAWLHPRRPLAAIFAGALGGIAILCWAPFLVSFPAVLLAGWILDKDARPEKSRVLFSLLVCLSGACTVVAFYALAMHVGGIHGVSGLLAWVHESITDSKESKALRMLSGMARGVYDLGDFAVWLKWYVFHDPYARVGFSELLRGSLARIALFYAALLGLVVLLWSAASGGKRLLLFVAVATLPHIAIALLYESSGVERYVGFMPAWFLGFGYLIGAAALGSARRIAAGLLCCAHIPFNIASASDRNIGNVLQHDPPRLAALLSLTPQTHAYVLNTFDPLFGLLYGEPMNPLHQRSLPVVDTLPPFARIPLWRTDFACTVLSVSDQGGEVWVTKRVLSPQPQRDWLWVERDQIPLRWSDLHAYFSTFDASIQRGGPDGFFRVSATVDLRSRLLADIQSSRQSSGAACLKKP